MKARIFTDEEHLVAKSVNVVVKEIGRVEASRLLSLPQKETHRIRKAPLPVAGKVTKSRVIRPRI